MIVMILLEAIQDATSTRAGTTTAEEGAQAGVPGAQAPMTPELEAATSSTAAARTSTVGGAVGILQTRRRMLDGTHAASRPPEPRVPTGPSEAAPIAL